MCQSEMAQEAWTLDNEKFNIVVVELDNEAQQHAAPCSVQGGSVMCQQWHIMYLNFITKFNVHPAASRVE